MVPYSTIRKDTARYGTVRDCTIQGTTRYGTAVCVIYYIFIYPYI